MLLENVPRAHEKHRDIPWCLSVRRTFFRVRLEEEKERGRNKKCDRPHTARCEISLRKNREEKRERKREEATELATIKKQ